MAVNDEDWQNFLNSTEEDPDEVETDDESEDEDDEDIETTEKKKKSTKSDEDEGADDDLEDDPKKINSGEEDEDDEGDDPDTAYKPRLKQFLKKDGSLDAEKVEKGYIATSKSLLDANEKLEKVNGDYDALLKAIKSKPEAAKALFGEESAKKMAAEAGADKAPQSPLLRHLEAQLTNAQRKGYADFVDKHPEAVTDPEKVAKIGPFLKLHSEVHQGENNGEIPPMKEALEAAYKYYGWDLEIDDKEAIAEAAKKRAATRHTPNGRRKASKKESTQGEAFFASKLGVTLK